MPTEAYYLKRMSSGKLVDIGNLSVEEVDLDDIETSLNNLYRFTGHEGVRKPLTVAQHSLLCLWIAQDIYPDEPELWKEVFVHDFGEAYIGDIATPIKKAIGKPFYDWAKPLEATVEKAILGYTVSQENHMLVKVCDNLAYDIECRSMWNQRRGKNKIVTNAPFVYGRVKDRVAMFDMVAQIPYVNFREKLKEIDDAI